MILKKKKLFFSLFSFLIFLFFIILLKNDKMNTVNTFNPPLLRIENYLYKKKPNLGISSNELSNNLLIYESLLNLNEKN